MSCNSQSNTAQKSSFWPVVFFYEGKWESVSEWLTASPAGQGTVAGTCFSFTPSRVLSQECTITGCEQQGEQWAKEGDSGMWILSPCIEGSGRRPTRELLGQLPCRPLTARRGPSVCLCCGLSRPLASSLWALTVVLRARLGRWLVSMCRKPACICRPETTNLLLLLAKQSGGCWHPTCWIVGWWEDRCVKNFATGESKRVEQAYP